MRKDDIWISDWHPEDEAFWEAKGKTIARRNLIWSILAEHIGFSIWLIWSIVATKLPLVGFHYSTGRSSAPLCCSVRPAFSPTSSRSLTRLMG